MLVLPYNFYILEDIDFVYLYYGNERIAIFTKNADPKEISKTCFSHLESLEGVKNEATL